MLAIECHGTPFILGVSILHPLLFFEDAKSNDSFKVMCLTSVMRCAGHELSLPVYLSYTLTKMHILSSTHSCIYAVYYTMFHILVTSDLVLKL